MASESLHPSEVIVQSSHDHKPLSYRPTPARQVHTRCSLMPIPFFPCNKVVEMFPGYLYKSHPDATEWTAHVSAVVYRPTNDDTLRRTLLQGTASIAHFFGHDRAIAEERVRA
jgi:hypothetical protein